VPDSQDWNTQIIEEFRANEGKVGGPFEGAPLLLLVTTGRKSGRTHVSPMMYLPEGDVMYVFASKAGAPTHPDWYHNLMAAPTSMVEVGTDRFEVTAQELTGAARDEVYARQAAMYPGFADYEAQTARTIPVVALRRVGPEG
jgi:deazaflavin-dependent oxidoreductase (nitroreductase family)